MGLLNQQQPQGRKANPQEQQAYKTLVTQLLKVMSEPESREGMQQMTEQLGPEKALAMMIVDALQGIGAAAKEAGVDIPNHTGVSALGEVVTVLVSMMAASGLLKDVNQSVTTVMDLIMSGGQGAQEQGNPAMMEG